MSFRCTASIAGSADILRKALASASGFFVISADPASAIYSRLREMAKRIRLAKRKPIAAISKAINMKMKMALEVSLMLQKQKEAMTMHKGEWNQALL